MSDFRPIAVDEITAATITGISVSSLQKMRVRGDGPHYAKIGNRVRYRLVDLDEFISERIVRSTSAAQAA